VKSPTSPRAADSKLQAMFETHKPREKQLTQPSLGNQPNSPVLFSKYESFSAMQNKVKQPIKPITPTLQQLIGKAPSSDIFQK
jgi:hypothetical protein